MSMFDYYRPARSLRCPECSRDLTEWQGKDGPNALFVWMEGEAFPIDQRVDDDIRTPADELDRCRLPPRFVIYSYDCPRHQPIEADCVAPQGVWTSTVLRSRAG